MIEDRMGVWDRLGIAAVVLLIAAFTFGAMSALATAANAGDELSGKRDDDARELVAVGDDDDDDGDSNGTNGSTGSKGSGDSGSRSIGSNSANTRTGTTNGTGVSRSASNSSDRSKNTQTGTTQGTGGSRASISNSS